MPQSEIEADEKGKEGSGMKGKKLGPAMRLLAPKLRESREQGQCAFLRCMSKTLTDRSKWCKEHKAEVRRLQLELNNVVWRKRVAKDEAGHHVAYSQHPTEWALHHRTDALRQAQSGHAIYSPKELREMLAKAGKGRPG